MSDRSASEASATSEAALREELAHVRAHLAALQRGHAELSEWLSHLQPAVDELSHRVAGDSPLSSPDTIELERYDAGLGGTVMGFRGGDRAAAAGDTYRGFEDIFRGSEETIATRQRGYLAVLGRRGPVLDVGCGRGELLSILDEAGVPASGLDLDAGMVQRCRDKGLQAEVGDGVEALTTTAPGSLGAIVALQLIEHLPYPRLIKMLGAAHRALAPGGRLVMETINPHAPQGLKHFWIDPTHQHPLYPEVIVALCALTGFQEAFVWYPAGDGDPERDRRAAIDYAVVAQTAS